MKMDKASFSNPYLEEDLQEILVRENQKHPEHEVTLDDLMCDFVKLYWENEDDDY